MKRMPTPALLMALAVVAGPVAAATAAPDPLIGKQLKGLGYSHEVDEDDDYRLVFELDEGRTQLVYVRSAVEEYGNVSVREIWSPGYTADTDSLPAALANRLLEESNQAKLGGWVKQARTAMFVVKIPGDADAAQLADAIEAATRSADALELDLTGKDEL